MTIIPSQDPLLSGYINGGNQYVQDDFYSNIRGVVNNNTSNDTNYTNYTTYEAEPDVFKELQNKLQNTEPAVIDNIVNSEEYKLLEENVQMIIHQELINIIKPRLVANRQLTESIKKQIEFINKTENLLREEERQNISEINDYIKNYSHLTFNEYRSLKNAPRVEK